MIILCVPRAPLLLADAAVANNFESRTLLLVAFVAFVAFVSLPSLLPSPAPAPRVISRISLF